MSALSLLTGDAAIIAVKSINVDANDVDTHSGIFKAITASTSTSRSLVFELHELYQKFDDLLANRVRADLLI